MALSLYVMCLLQRKSKSSSALCEVLIFCMYVYIVFADSNWGNVLGILDKSNLGNGWNTVSRVLFRKRELTEFCDKLGYFYEKLGEFALAHK